MARMKQENWDLSAKKLCILKLNMTLQILVSTLKANGGFEGFEDHLNIEEEMKQELFFFILHDFENLTTQVIRGHFDFLIWNLTDECLICNILKWKHPAVASAAWRTRAGWKHFFAFWVFFASSSDTAPLGGSVSPSESFHPHQGSRAVTTGIRLITHSPRRLHTLEILHEAWPYF